ncbi:AAA family ATPase [Ideonella sp. B508-1]|uniref:AAA family ATPase n=1 Tax=Ideonella sp. B508-1 TaxID=137716 RepID=UPI00034BC62E|nr:AAA family ATPase [Ideonella sp. B508-1]
MSALPKPDWAKLDADRAKVLAARQDAGPPPTPGVRLLRGDAVTLEAVQWAWPGFLPAGMLTLLGGAPGCGKTTIALDLAATITMAGTWPDGTRCRQAGDVMVWSGEDPAPVTAARLVASGADMRRVHFIDGLTGCEGEGFDPGRHMDLLESTACKLAAPRLLILDPIVSAVTGDGHKSNDVRRSLQPVVDLAHRLGCAVLGITHFSKGTGGRDPVERITGSLAFAALARLVLVAAKVKQEDGDESRRVLVRAKSNIGPDDGGFAYGLERVEVAPEVEGQRVRWLEPLKGTAREVLAEAEADAGDEEETALDEACAFLRSELRLGPKPAKYLLSEARNAGHSERTLKRAKQRLGIESRKEATAWLWGMTDDVQGWDCQGSKSAKGAKESVPEIPGTVGPLGPLDEDSEVF